MSTYVVDSSVAIKWYVPEVLDTEAHRVRDGGALLYCPDFLAVETAAVLWKKIRRDNLPRSDADDILNDLGKSPLIWQPTGPLVSDAFDLADRTNRSVYDCLYLALAVQLDTVLVTADDRLANALVGTAWAKYVLKLQNVP